MSAEQPSLRQRIADAIRTTPATGWTHTPGEERFDHHTDGGHNYSISCGLCRNDVDALAAAVESAVQPELDQLRTELDDLHGRLNDIESLCDHAESDALATWQDPQPVPQWATDVRAICRREPARPGCPDPIECDHEAEAGQLRAELDRTRAELADTARFRDFHMRSAGHLARKRDRAEQLIGRYRNGDIDAEAVIERIARALSVEGDDAPPPPSADGCGCRSATHPGHYPSCPTRADAPTT